MIYNVQHSNQYGINLKQTSSAAAATGRSCGPAFAPSPCPSPDERASSTSAGPGRPRRPGQCPPRRTDNLHPCCISLGRGSRPMVPAQLEGGVSSPGGSNPNDPLAEGSKVVPAAYSTHGSLESLPWSLPRGAQPGSCLEGLVYRLSCVELGQGSPVLPIALWRRSPAGTINIGI